MIVELQIGKDDVQATYRSLDGNAATTRQWYPVDKDYQELLHLALAAKAKILIFKNPSDGTERYYLDVEDGVQP